MCQNLRYIVVLHSEKAEKVLYLIVRELKQLVDQRGSTPYGTSDKEKGTGTVEYWVSFGDVKEIYVLEGKLNKNGALDAQNLNVKSSKIVGTRKEEKK